ncbi:DUF2752 domain-containing protein [Sphingobacterium mizutaii]|uniref:DUF2752 domain-containing protein n=1 Tax=Sphingobacterium mizutaii TaxID=1010 RepID=UPI001628F261|nr:DUF2752 domain-containing protein [Sphingobacterium mizutaii]
MRNPRSRLYITTGIVCFIGIIWLLLDYYASANITLCPVKLVTGYPCPSCGTTRSISALFNGQLKDAFMINPLGIVSSIIIMAVLVLMLLDLVAKRDCYYKVYNQVEKFLQQHKAFSAILVILVILNWAWNISKGL